MEINEEMRSMRGWLRHLEDGSKSLNDSLKGVTAGENKEGRTRTWEFMRLERRHESSACDNLWDAKHGNICHIDIHTRIF